VGDDRPMLGLMQDYPLTTNWIFGRAGQYYPDKEIVTRTVAGIERSTVADMATEARKIAGYLDSVGISPDGRVGTFGWNTARHLSLYFAIPGTGRVMHTINIRYFAEQLIYTVEHAEDEAIFVDRSLLPLLGKYLPELNSVQHVIVMDDGADCEVPDDPRIVGYDDAVGSADELDFTDRVEDERQAAAICYTTGTTGNPKGVLYSHRSAWLHSNAISSTGAFSLDDTDRVLPVVPMFHANAWGLPYGCMLAGAAMVMPGPDLSPKAVLQLLQDEKVTLTAGVPTIWMGLVPLLDDYDLSTLRMIVCGGSAVPKSLSEAFRQKIGRPIRQAWGMTETSPLASVCVERGEFADASEDEKADLRATAGVAPPGVELRIVDSETREPQPWDDTATGEIEVRGPWIAARYFNDDSGDDKFDSGWLRTGDIAAVDADGFVQITDRAKDVIKSGGEWISSVELENEMMSHPDVVEAAVIAKPDERWAERPLCCVVLREGASATAPELVEHLRGRVAKWWLPDEFAFLEEIPKTSVGKFDKKVLRGDLSEGSLAGRVRVS
jgi:fatty-acyl-CoA synthase